MKRALTYLWTTHSGTAASSLRWWRHAVSTGNVENAKRKRKRKHGVEPDLKELSRSFEPSRVQAKGLCRLNSGKKKRRRYATDAPEKPQGVTGVSGSGGASRSAGGALCATTAHQGGLVPQRHLCARRIGHRAAPSRVGLRRTAPRPTNRGEWGAGDSPPPCACAAALPGGCPPRGGPANG